MFFYGSIIGGFFVMGYYCSVGSFKVVLVFFGLNRAMGTSTAELTGCMLGAQQAPQ